jgi:uncharacterized membrane protein
MNKKRIWLLGLILIAFGLRLAFLDKQSLWYDEGVTWMLSKMLLPDLINWTAEDIQPPFYYLFIWNTDIIFGDREWALRFPSVVFNILTLPLIYILARRIYLTSSASNLASHQSGMAASILAVILSALSPLMVYYSQEARMYTLLVFESTLAGYLLLRILDAQGDGPFASSTPVAGFRPTSTTLWYIVTGALALHTHYFAAFLLAAHMLYALFVLWQRRFPKALLIQLLWSFGGCLLLFTPWLPILLARLGDDPSYWPGALKLNEAVRKVIISFTVGETVFEQIGWWLALGYLAILLFCGLWLSRMSSHRSSNKAEQNRPSLIYLSSFLFLLLWLLLPIILILALSYQSPKFNPRYTLLSWPAFALILAGFIQLAMSNLRQLTHIETEAAPSAPYFIFHLLSIRVHWLRFMFYVLRFTFYVFILASMFYSLANWFTDSRFSKADFRALAQFVRERKAGDETVLLSSGHVFPVWAYYYGWEGWTPLPWMLRLDVNRVTDLTIAGNIAEAIEGQGGVWLVTWQDEVIDPSGIVPFWLDLIGRRPIDAGDFWGVGLEHWRLDPEKVGLLKEDPIQRPAAFNFDNRVELAGYTQLNDTELALFWRPLQPLPDDLVLTFDLTDSEGFDWARETFVGRPGAYLYPPSRWPMHEIVMTRHRLDWQIGAPPGLYIAEVGLGENSAPTPSAATASAAPTFTSWDILDQQGRPQRRTALLEFINLSNLVQPPSGPLPMDKTPLVDFFPIVGVRRAILPQSTAQPGDRILLALLWQAGEFNLDDISVAIDLIDTEGQKFRVASSLTPSRRFSLPRWKPAEIVLGQYWLDIPPAVASGPATLELHLINESGWTYHELFPIAKIEILPTERNFTPPDRVDMAVEADFSGQATLLGADCPAACRASAGSSITLTLYWRAETTFETNYTVFTHLLGPAETVIINADHTPPRPTQGWVGGEIITDPVTLTIPPDLASGSYPIEVGLYNAADPAYQRLPLTNGETRIFLPQRLIIQ